MSTQDNAFLHLLEEARGFASSRSGTDERDQLTAQDLS